MTCRPSGKKIVILWIYMLLILSTSLIPMDREIEGFGMIMEITPFVQNLLHAPVFALLSVLWVQIMNVHQIRNRRKYILVFIIGVGFGLLNELIQGVVPGRYPSIFDMGINVVGVVMGMWFFRWIENSEPNRIRRFVCE